MKTISLSLLQEELADALGRVQQAAGIEAQVQDQAAHARGGQLVQLLLQLVRGGAGEVLHPDVADVVDHEGVGHALDLDDVAGDGEGQRDLHARAAGW